MPDIENIAARIVASLRHPLNALDASLLADNLGCMADDETNPVLEAVIHDCLRFEKLYYGGDAREVSPPEPDPGEDFDDGTDKLLELLIKFRNRIPSPPNTSKASGSVRALDHMIHHLAFLLRFCERLRSVLDSPPPTPDNIHR